MRILKAGAMYAAMVFGAGFVLGVIRTLWLVPELGARSSELLEMPFMLLVVFLAARWLQRRFGWKRQGFERLLVGFIALSLLLLAEIVLGAVLRGAPIQEVLFDRDPISGVAYYLSLTVFALMPWMLGKHAWFNSRS